MHSYEKVNYSIRPNKRTQRKMIFDALSSYRLLLSERDFEYIGFGSMWFSDFLLAHRLLGLKSLISIEKSDGFKRAAYNRPFKCIKVLEGEASSVLPTLPLKKPAIVWLDYDYGPESESLQDISLLSQRLLCGSVLVISFEARPPWKERDGPSARRKALKTLGRHGLVAPLRGRGGKVTHLSHYPATLSKMLWDFLHGSLVSSGRAEGEKLAWKPLFSFSYRDSVQMITIGGALVGAMESRRIQESRLCERNHFLGGEDVFTISVPPLTQRERAEIDRRLPDKKVTLPFPLSSEHLQSYIDLYRFYPLMAEVEL